MHNRRNRKRLIALVVIAGIGLLVWHEQRPIQDWYLLKGYTPSNNIMALAADTTMTPKATHDFYVNHPNLEDAAIFNANCPAGSEQTIILGCYRSDQAGIFLYKVSDMRLQGVEQVTAAHEMLHAAYDRLSDKDRNYVDGLLEDYYQHDLHDQRVLDTIAAYKKTEPNDVINEMHSVFGTEVEGLPASLETYYAQYFTSRAKITAYAASYTSEFTSRRNQVAQDDIQLGQLKSNIANDEADLATRRSDLRALQAQLNVDIQENQVTVYNAGVAEYNAKVNTYNTALSTTKKLIDAYNQLVTARNAIAVQEQQLEQALNSQFAPIANR